jgi:hypothetical protein
MRKWCGDGARLIWFAGHGRAYIDQVLDYHELRKTLIRWTKDREWISNLKPKSDAFATLFPVQALGSLFTPANALRDNVLRKFGDYALMSTFQTHSVPRRAQGSTISVHFKDVIGRIAGIEWISDDILFFCLNKLMEYRTDVIVLDPLVRADTYVPPFDDLKTLKYVIQPMAIGRHWVLLVVEIFWSESPPMAVAHAYEPTMSATATEKIKSTFQSQTHSLLERWLQRRYTGESLDQKITVWAGPLQPDDDGHNCGFLCLLVAYAIVAEFQFPHKIQCGGSYSETDMEVLRLKLLHLILQDSTAPPLHLTIRQAGIVEKVTSVMKNTGKNAV